MKKVLTILFLSVLVSQTVNISGLIDSVLIGNPEPAEELLPTLVVEYPNNPEVMFLQGLLEMNGEKAKDHFKTVYDTHPNSDYGDDAVMKVAEYYYTTGYYIQSADWLKKMPLYYPRSSHIERAVKLFLNSLIVSGSKDTALFYSKVFKRRFPKMDIDAKLSDVLASFEANTQKNKSQFVIEPVKEVVSNEDKQFSLQIGAFGKVDNAKSRKKMLVNSGFNPRIDQVESNGNILFAVREGHYSDKESAKKIGKQIKARLGLNTIVVKNK